MLMIINSNLPPFVFDTFDGRFDHGVALPDSTTIYRFGNQLVAAGLNATLRGEVNRQLEGLSLKVIEARGAVIDGCGPSQPHAGSESQG